MKNFTAPHSVRVFRTDMGFLPALWANDGDMVLVEDAERARTATRKAGARLARSGCGKIANVEFVTACELAEKETDTVEVWGWDTAVAGFIERSGLKYRRPDADRLDAIRMLSHRKTAAELLTAFNGRLIVGESFLCGSEYEVAELMAEYGQIVIKAPWSCSGRGIRFAEGNIGSHLSGWIKNMLKAQGGVTVEPYYRKVKDFGMEFVCDGQGHVDYLGLSLFSTLHGAYTGNMLATEACKQEIIRRYLPAELIEEVKEFICNRLGEVYKGRYEGPLGIDMMIVANGDGRGFLLHPCVEINLRRTMGHVALAVAPEDDEIIRSMEIVNNNNNYQLKIKSL